jgi:hypothetical protein
MRLRARSKLRTAFSHPVVLICSYQVLALIGSAMSLGQQREVRPELMLGVEINLSSQRPPIRHTALRGHSRFIPRQSLTINDSRAETDLAGIELSAEMEGDGIRVSLFLFFNDRSNHQNDKTKTAGSYLLRMGESISPPELNQFGIEPFEIKVIDARPVEVKPGEGPRITNTASLKVEKLERHFDSYHLWLKNKSDKNIVAYELSTGTTASRSSIGTHGTSGPVLAAGATSSELSIYDREIEVNGIEIRLVVFEDGTFEGDSKLGTEYLAKTEGVKVQSPSVLRRIEQTLTVDDSDLRDTFVKLEAELWLIPEALDKPSSIQFLKTKFPAEDEKSLSALYEVFKGGLYDARNIALSSLGETLRTVQRLEERSRYASAVESIRRTLEQLKETFEKITSAQR